jgi:hypothetical protein
LVRGERTKEREERGKRGKRGGERRREGYSLLKVNGLGSIGATFVIR